MTIAAKKDMILLQDAKGCPFKKVELSPAQRPLWVQTRTKFLWEAPGFSHILYKLMGPGIDDHIVWTNDVPTAATDGVYIFANPEWYFKLTLSGRVFVLGHEVLHAVFNHPIIFHGWRTKGKVVTPEGTILPYDELTMQHAADYILNAILADSKIGKYPEAATQSKLLDPGFISHRDQLTVAYKKLYKKNPPKNPSSKPGHGQMDGVLVPGKGSGQTPGQAKAQRNEQVWKTATAAAVAAQKARGLLSGSLQDCFGELLDPQVSWDEYIIGWFKRKLGSGSWNFRRADRHYICRDPMIYAPSRQGYGADVVAIGVDTSGSVTREMVTRFFAEMLGVIQDVKPRKLLVFWCDAEVQRVDEVETYEDLADLYHKGIPGRGGTRFEPVFDRLKEDGIKPDALIYFTDGYGSFPAAPDYPVLWGDIEGKVKFPFGDVIKIPV